MSGNLNSVLIDGNLTRDPETKTTPRGSKICNFGLASNRYYEQNDERVKEVSFFEIESWSRLAEACGNHLTKGRGVRVVGRLKQDRWADPDGNARNRVKIVAEHIIFKPIITKPAEADNTIEEGTQYDLAVAENE
ncbi:MAG: single-stranded DNA-binding protein [Salinispira sp.]